MKINFLQIYEGWRNHLIPPAHLKKAIKQVSHERLLICRTCEFNSRNVKNTWIIRKDEHCTICMCTLSAKTKCLSCDCPKEYWNALLTLEQEILIDNEKKNSIKKDSSAVLH